MDLAAVGLRQDEWSKGSEVKRFAQKGQTQKGLPGVLDFCRAVGQKVLRCKKSWGQKDPQAGRWMGGLLSLVRNSSFTKAPLEAHISLFLFLLLVSVIFQQVPNF